MPPTLGWPVWSGPPLSPGSSNIQMPIIWALESEALLPDAPKLAKYWITLVFSVLPAPDSPLIGKDQRSKERCGYTVYMILQGAQSRKQEHACYPYVISIDWCSRSAMTGHERGQTNRVSVREESNCCWFPSVSTVNNTDSCPDAAKPFSTPLKNHHTAHWLHTSSNCRLKTYNCATTGHLHVSAPPCISGPV